MRIYRKAYEILQRVSKSKSARMAYEARQAEIMDQLTREKSAREEGKSRVRRKDWRRSSAEGKAEGIIAVAEKMLRKNRSDEEVAEFTELSMDEVFEIRKRLGL